MLTFTTPLYTHPQKELSDYELEVIQRHSDKFAAFNNGIVNSAKDALEEIKAARGEG